ncbi:MAG: elongation factor 4 [Candidatus Wildermuthbacteria bacterium]|nr:elongation factor 4 [Candidatus Wildermuthbacteria bacterium]
MQDHIRNFCIIAHIDHGKSTLADRFLELTKTVDNRKMQEQFLDQMDLERERGITIKMTPVRMAYRMPSGEEYVLNLIDTPGHVDFSYEVSRSLAAVEGAILLVDATKGIQAQTLSNINLAKAEGLVIIPVVNKIDSPLARTEEVVKEIADLLLVEAKDVLSISAKMGTNVEQLLCEVIKRVPSPSGEPRNPLRALIFDSTFDAYKGVIAYVRVVDGEVRANEKIIFLGTGAEAVTKEVGYFMPAQSPAASLYVGEIGYIATGVKDSDGVRIGDTIAVAQANAIPLEGYKTPKPVVFMSFYPQNPNEFDNLKDALSQLKLNDPSFSYEIEAKEALGRGFRCGFLGVLHSEIIAERVQREFRIEMVISRPSVEFRVIDKHDKELSVKTPVDWPNETLIKEIFEPWVRLEVITPLSTFPITSQLLEHFEGKQNDLKYLGEDRLLLVYEMPLRSIVEDLYDKLKSATQGLASLDYEVAEWRKADLVKLEVLIAGVNEEALAMITPRHQAYSHGKSIVEKLKESLPPQQFDVALQAAVGGKILARETIRARRKDVTAPLYGGDVTRKRKLLEKQKKGKKEMKEKGRVTIPSKVFLDIFRS